MSRLTRPLLLVLALALLATGCEGVLGPTTEPRVVEAVFTRSNNLFEGSEVRVLGLAVGTVASLHPEGPNVRARMEIDPETELPADVRAVIIPESLLGERFVQLDPPYTGGATLDEGAIIPLERTGVPAEVDEVLSSFETFLAGLDPQTIAELVDTLAETLAGQGEDLNRLLDQGATTIRVLADSSDDLMAIVSEFADLNTAVATRDQQLRAVIEDWSTVVRTIAEESDDIIEGVDNLRRLSVALRSLLDPHVDDLVLDLEVLATSLSTVERNLDRLYEMAQGARLLFEGAGRAMEYEHGRLRLNNQTQHLSAAIERRLRERLVGVCMRLGLDVCATIDFWESVLPPLSCLNEEIQPGCEGQNASFADAVTEALGLLPPEALEVLAAEAEQRAAEEAAAPRSDEAAPSAYDRLPRPQLTPPPLDAEEEDEVPLRERVARILGGRR